MSLLEEILGLYTLQIICFEIVAKKIALKNTYNNSRSENLILSMNVKFSDNHHLIQINLHLTD